MNLEKRFPLLIFLTTFLVYLNGLFSSFQFDDYNVIVDYAPVHTLGGYLSDLQSGMRPLLKLSYLLNYLASPDPFGFHLINNLIHAANAVLVYQLTLLLFPRVPAPKIRLLALFSALLFALHPAATEAVTYVSGRSVSLMAFFLLLSLYLYLLGAEKNSALLKNLLSPLAFLLAVLVRETAVILPLVLLLWEVGVSGKTLREAAKNQLAHLWLLSLLVTAAVFQGRMVYNLLEGFNYFGGGSFFLRQTHGIFYLLTQYLDPVTRNIDPDFPHRVSLTLSTALEAATLFALLISGLLLLRRNTPLGFGLLWFFVQLLPTNSLIPRTDVANERHLYLAGLGLTWVIVYGLYPVIHRFPRVALTGAVWLFLFLGWETVARNQDYRTEITLWEATVKVSPLKARAHNNLGYAYLDEERLLEAKKEFSTALSLDPESENARANLSIVERRLSAKENP